MSRPGHIRVDAKLTPFQVRTIRATARKRSRLQAVARQAARTRADALAEFRATPTLRQHAIRLGIHLSRVKAIANGTAYKGVER